MEDQIKNCPKCGAKLISHDIFRNFKMIENYYCIECNWPSTEEDYQTRIKLKLGE